MSGTVKKVTDIAFKAGKNIDLEGMAKLLVFDEPHKRFITLSTTLIKLSRPKREFQDASSMADMQINRF
ncbi:ATP synthase subunit d, mitochondrial [Senna tora]|uniref:ATP synthase subunit d, mitochondrial n=1 Tax=Senna tora TaxID=362788 RepID=A0A834TTR1_9FABA|nr:ATP synthase subunit d, mitochondrial [Senna tora]